MEMGPTLGIRTDFVEREAALTDSSCFAGMLLKNKQTVPWVSLKAITQQV